MPSERRLSRRRAAAIAAARAGLGTRFRAQGRLIGVGLDCVGVALLAAAGAVVGTAASVPALAVLADLAAPWTGAPARGLAALPWVALAAVPPLAFLVGWTTAQFTVRRWLRQLP